MKWAPKLENLQPSDFSLPEKGRIEGEVSGYAEFINGQPEPGSPAEGEQFEINYVNYSDDGIHILNGTEVRINHMHEQYVDWNADITVTGHRKGLMKADSVRFYSWSIGSGTIRAELGEYVIEVDLARGLPTGVPGELR